jgi:putative ABC transport system substrate-binding protein
VKRRDFIVGLGGAAAWPVVVRAQQPTMARIGVLMNGAPNDARYQLYVMTFLRTLRALGWRDGENIRFEVRWPAGDAERIRDYAADLVGTAPNLILSSSSANLTALLRLTHTIPIVFVLVSDPGTQGFVSNLARPGGNVTGFSAFEPSIAGKWIDLLKQLAPRLARVAAIFNPDTSPQSKLFLPVIAAATPTFAVDFIAAPVHDKAEVEQTIESFSRQPNSGLIFPSDQFTSSHSDFIVEQVARYRLPAIYATETFARNGGLIVYGFDQQIQFRQAAIYVDRILKGVSPGDLPIQQPTKFFLIINAGAARAIGIEVPISLSLIADEVIE